MTTKTTNKKTAGKKILIAEDEAILLRALTLHLTGAGFHIVCAKDGEEAVALVKKEHPDLFILDILMPKLNGLDALKRLRATPEGKKLPTIILSNLDSGPEQERAEKLGVLTYYLKASINLEELVGFITNFFNKKK